MVTRETPHDVDYNRVFKKLVGALWLPNTDVPDIFALSPLPQSKSACHGYSVGEGSKNYRPMSREVFMAFLDGLYEYYRPEDGE